MSFASSGFTQFFIRKDAHDRIGVGFPKNLPNSSTFDDLV